jgi:sterol 14-demethylase
MVADLVLNAKREKGAPPVYTGGWPIVGHFLRFAANPLATIRDGYSKHGPVFTMRFLHYNMTFLVGTEAHTPFFRANDTELSQNEPYKFMTPIFGEGIVFDAPIEVKNQQLKFVAGALKGSALKTYVSMIADEVERFLESEWGAEGEKDLLDEMSNLTILTASRCLLGPEIRGTLFGTFSQLFREIDEGINPIAIFFPNAPLPAFRCVPCPVLPRSSRGMPCVAGSLLRTPQRPSGRNRSPPR